MGRLRRSRTHSSAKKNQATDIKTKRYGRDIDQIHDDVKDGGKRKLADDLRRSDIDDIPGMAQHKCVPCARYFDGPISLETHLKTKIHKKRVKVLKEKPYSIEESRAAAGLGVDNGAH